MRALRQNVVFTKICSAYPNRSFDWHDCVVVEEASDRGIYDLNRATRRALRGTFLPQLYRASLHKYCPDLSIWSQRTQRTLEGPVEREISGTCRKPEPRLPVRRYRRLCRGCRNLVFKNNVRTPLMGLARMMKINRPKSPEEAAAGLISEARRDCKKCEEECAKISAQLSAMQAGHLPAVMKELGRRWLTSTVPNPIEDKAIDDPIYGHIVLDKALATVVPHPLLQRLARVKQLSFSFAQFPSSRHSRLSHSLGVAKNAERALNGIFDRGVYYVVGEKQPVQFDKQSIEQRRELIRKARVAAVLHDVGHGPFGHALDSYAGITLRVERPDKHYTESYVGNYLAPTLQSVQIDVFNVLSILSSDRADLKGFDNLIGDIIDSSLDVDRMDYLMRDAHMTGLIMGFINTSALIDFMKPVLDQDTFILAYDEQALAYMEHLILARDFMYFNCYEHPRKKAAERIFTRLVQSIVEDRRLDLLLDQVFALADEELMTVFWLSVKWRRGVLR